MRAKEYEVLQMAVESGVVLGWQHAHKHVEKPGESAICDRITEDVLTAICEWFDFPEPEREERVE